MRPLRFVVVWSDPGNRDGSEGAVVGQRINRVGNAIGGEFIVNSYTTGDQRYPDVVRGIRAHRFGPRARKRGSELAISTFEYGPHRTPSIDVTDDGFVVVWGQGADYSYYSGQGPSCGVPPGETSPEYRCQDGVGLGVVAQRLDAEGGKVDRERIVTGGFGQIDQHQGVVAAQPPGRFVVGWTDAGWLSGENYDCRYFHNHSGVRTQVFGTAPP